MLLSNGGFRAYDPDHPINLAEIKKNDSFLSCPGPHSSSRILIIRNHCCPLSAIPAKHDPLTLPIMSNLNYGKEFAHPQKDSLHPRLSWFAPKGSSDGKVGPSKPSRPLTPFDRCQFGRSLKVIPWLVLIHNFRSTRKSPLTMINLMNSKEQSNGRLNAVDWLQNSQKFKIGPDSEFLVIFEPSVGILGPTILDYFREKKKATLWPSRGLWLFCGLSH